MTRKGVHKSFAALESEFSEKNENKTNGCLLCVFLFSVATNGNNDKTTEMSNSRLARRVVGVFDILNVYLFFGISQQRETEGEIKTVKKNEQK